MRRRISGEFGLGICLLAILWLTTHLAPSTTASAANNLLFHSRATPAVPSSFDKAPVLVLDQATTDSLDESTAIRTYQFKAKLGEQYRVAVELTDGNFFTSVSVVSTDLIHVLGETDGADLIDSSLHFVAPADATYGIIVSYNASTFGTPVPGKYTVILTQIQPKSYT